MTSNPSVESGELLNQRDRRLIEAAIAFKKKKGLAHEKDVEEYKGLCASLHKRLEKVRALLLSGELADAEDLLDICGLEMEALYACRFKDAGKSRGIKEKIEKMTDVLSYAKEAQGLRDRNCRRLMTVAWVRNSVCCRAWGLIDKM